MNEKIYHAIHKICDIIELIIAGLVVIGLVCSLIYYLPHGIQLLFSSHDTTDFLLFMEDLFNLVVGIEFIKMLCKPSAGNVIEVLVFLVARHMIIGSSSALDIFLSVLSVALLYTIRYGLRVLKSRSIPEVKDDMLIDL